MKFSNLIFIIVAIALAPRAHAGIHIYEPVPGLKLRYVTARPLTYSKEKFPVIIFQDGDGTVADSYSPLAVYAWAAAVSQLNGVLFVAPELRRQALVKDPLAYCQLDFNHRQQDLHRLIDEVKKLPEADTQRLYLVGMSAGSEVVSAVANQRRDITAVVTVGGGVLQLADLIKAGGGDPRVFEATKNVCTTDNWRHRSGKFWHQLLYSGLEKEIRRIRIPYLAIMGEKDLVVPHHLTWPRALEVMMENPYFHYLTDPEMAHGFGLNLFKWNKVRRWLQLAAERQPRP